MKVERPCQTKITEQNLKAKMMPFRPRLSPTSLARCYRTRTTSGHLALALRAFAQILLRGLQIAAGRYLPLSRGCYK